MIALAISAMMYFFYGIAQLKYKMDAGESIASHQGLHTLKVSLKDFNKLACKNEIWYEGQLYDVSNYTITGEIVYIVVFHDEHEESLVKNAIDNFEPYDKYISDNTVHIVKHRIHPPDDSKILVTPFILQNIAAAKVYVPMPYFINYSSPVYSHILKPPPDMA